MSHFPERLRYFCGTVFAAVVAAGVVLAASERGPEMLPLLLFGALVVFGEHRAVVLPNNMMVSPGFMVLMASIVVFSAQGSLLGPLLVGVASGFYVPHLARGMRPWIPFNTGIIGLAMLSAALVYRAVPSSTTTGMPAAVIFAVPPALAFLAVSWALLGASYAVDGSRPVRDVVGELFPAGVQIMPFALLGLFLGRLYLEVGAPIVVLLVVPILVAREMFASYLELKDAHEATVEVLIRALEAKDRYTAGHAGRVAHYSRYVGEEMRFTPGRLERLRFAALMHDIGKLVVPNHLLNKPGRLTAEEFAQVRAHEQVSMEMLSRIDFLAPVAQISTTEHTQFDPADAKRAIEPYIVAVADAFDAMTTTRSYRKALDQDVAVAELRDKAGTQFHPACVEALVTAIERRGERHGAGHEEDSVEWRVAPPAAGPGSAGLGDLAPSGDTTAGGSP